MKITVVKNEGVISFAANPGEKLLYAGLRQGIGLPHECATGTCGSCRASLKSGQLRGQWEQAPGARSLKSSRNEFLMCQSTPTTDCEISFRGRLKDHEYAGYQPDYHRGQIAATELLTREVMRVKVVFEQPLSFCSGQFVVISVKDLEGGRAYSMVNPNLDGHELEFIVKFLPGGGFSNWLFNGPREGTPVTVFGPLGRATLAADEGRNLVFITGGSGIAGIMSVLAEALENGYFQHNKGHLFFGVRSYQELFFHNRLLQLCERSKQRLRISFTFSDGAIPGDSAEIPAGVEYLRGDVTPQALRILKGKLAKTLAFLAGPPPMVDDAIRRLVMDEGLPVGDIRYDKFA